MTPTIRLCLDVVAITVTVAVITGVAWMVMDFIRDLRK